MKSFKTTLSVSLLILFAGCASVTDANIEPNEPELEQVNVSQSNDTWDSRNGDDMDPLFEDRPSSSR